MLNLLQTLARERQEKITALRRHFHAHPELSFLEFETTKRVAQELTSLGYENVRIGTAGKETGVVADLNPHKSGPCFALRADMDALRMKEDSQASYKSQNPEAMHACGHDAHTAILLGAAGILRDIAEDLPGRVRFIFQPSEESPLPKRGPGHDRRRSSSGSGCHRRASCVGLPSHGSGGIPPRSHYGLGGRVGVHCLRQRRARRHAS